MKKTFITIIGLAAFTTVKAQQQNPTSVNDTSGVILISKPILRQLINLRFLQLLNMNQNFLVESESFINSFKTM